jgi:hypothetical protein
VIKPVLDRFNREWAGEETIVWRSLKRSFATTRRKNGIMSWGRESQEQFYFCWE